MEIKQYQIVVVSINNTSDTEPVNTKPCVVISPDEMNRHLRTVIIAPLTPDSQNYPTRLKIKHNNDISRVALDQIMTIEKQTIIEVLGDLSGSEIKKIKTVLKETFID